MQTIDVAPAQRKQKKKKEEDIFKGNVSKLSLWTVNLVSFAHLERASRALMKLSVSLSSFSALSSKAAVACTMSLARKRFLKPKWTPNVWMRMSFILMKRRNGSRTRKSRLDEQSVFAIQIHTRIYWRTPQWRPSGFLWSTYPWS